MKLAVHFSNFTVPGEPASLAGTIAATAKTADDGGCEAMTVMDHWFQMESRAPATDPMLEAYTTLGYIAALTTRLKLGTLVTGVTYRHPGLLAKTVATLDVLTEGRAFLGIGAAWYEREHQYFGIPFPPLGERFDRLEEQLAILTGIWDTKPGERFSFEGKHYQLKDCASIPRWASRPKIIIGGAGAKRTPTLAAKYADEFNGALGLDVAILRVRSSRPARALVQIVGEERPSLLIVGPSYVRDRRRLRSVVRQACALSCLVWIADGLPT